MPSDPRPRRVLVLNHHGDNRGDEAALRGLVAGLRRQLGDVRLVVVHQYADPASEVPLGVPTTYLSMTMGVVSYAALLLHALLLAVGVDTTRLLRGQPRRIARAYLDADVAVSAPGGPYFGDLYAGHEVAHWLLVWVAHLRGLPSVLYAPSVGPFEIGLLRPLRRTGFGWFDAIAVREDRSRRMLSAFTDGEVEAVVTADSALQQDHGPTAAEAAPDDDVLTVAVAARDPGAAVNPRYDEAVVAALSAVCGAHPTRLVFLPQLHL